MAKVILDWKAPSEKKMAEYVKTLGEDKMKSFAKACVERKMIKFQLTRAKLRIGY